MPAVPDARSKVHQLRKFGAIGQDVEGQSLAWNPNLLAAFTRGGGEVFGAGW